LLFNPNGIASGFQGLGFSWKSYTGNEVTKERRVRKWRSKGDAEKGEKESGSLAEAFMPKFARRTFRGSFVIFHEKAL